MTPREFEKILKRDGSRCIHCGSTEGLVPHHRMNRGMGGSKALETPSNVLTMCSLFNSAMESEGSAQAWAIRNGWKLVRVNPNLVGEVLRHAAVWDYNTGKWFALKDDYTREEVSRDYGKD